MWIMFALTAGYILLYRPGVLAKTFTHPVFLAVYGLIFVGVLMESLHPNLSLSDSSSSYGEIIRICQMAMGAVLVASLCRDKIALRAGMYGYLIAALWLSIVLVATSYGALQGLTAASFTEASQVRAKIFAGRPISENLDILSFFSAQGFVMALIFYLKSTITYKRVLFAGIAIFCLVATSLPLSRGGLLVAALTSSAILLKNRGSHIRAMVAVVLITAGIVAWFPNVLFSRLSLSTAETEGKMEVRARVYTVAIKTFPEYSVIGVGSGNFWGPWGYGHGFNNGAITIGAHNLFFQATIYWGFLGLLALIAVIGFAYRCIPKRHMEDEFALCLYGIAISLFLWAMVVHTLYAKEFSLGLGFLVGAKRWIWHTGFVTHDENQVVGQPLR